MNPFKYLFRKIEVPPVEPPADGHLRETIKTAKRENSQATKDFLAASRRQEDSADFARKVISDVLERADKLKVVQNAGYEK